jgi:hypothetical protein
LRLSGSSFAVPGSASGFLVAAVICAVAILPALGLRRPAPAQAAAQEGAASPDEDA